MVQFSTLLTLSTAFLFVQLSFVGASCPGDTHNSGCWMCQESQLGQCWHNAVNEIHQLEVSAEASTSDYCKAYAKLAKCWTTGTCCSEYAPLLAAATNLCNLATWPHIAEEELTQVLGTASWVREKIWTNNSGKDVPKLAVTVKAYSGSYEPTAPSDSYSAKGHSHTTKSTSYSQGTRSSHSSYKKSTAKQADDNEEEGNENESVAHSNDYSQKNNLHGKQIHSYQPELKAHDSLSKVLPPKVQHKANSVHHKAKCTVKESKCQTKTADKYHRARRSQTENNLPVRVDNPLLHKRAAYLHNADLYKRTTVTPQGCGRDFQGVFYPRKVPETVAKVYSEL